MEAKIKQLESILKAQNVEGYVTDRDGLWQLRDGILNIVFIKNRPSGVSVMSVCNELSKIAEIESFEFDVLGMNLSDKGRFEDRVGIKIYYK